MERDYSFIIFSLLIGIVFLILFFQYATFTGKIVNVGTYAKIDPGITVLYYTFDGSTTDFDLLTDEELEALDDMTLERTTLGKIVFSNTINLTQDADADFVVDLDSNVNISRNYVKINTTRLTSLDDLAVVSLYNIFVEDPNVLRNGEACPASICNVVGYSIVTGTVVFSVTNFSNASYSINETKEQVQQPTTSTGGGGGGASAKPKDVSKKVLLEIDSPPSKTLFSGDEINVLFSLKNTGDLQLADIMLNAKTNAPDVELSLSENSFATMDVGEENIVVLNVKSLTDLKSHIGINNYFVTLTADVGNFDYEVSAKLFITLKEVEYEIRLEADKQIQFAEDLFAEKQKCLEEYGYKLEEAKKYYDESDYKRALSTIDSAIQSCRDLLVPIGEWDFGIDIGKTGMAYIFGRKVDVKLIVNTFISMILTIIVLSLLLAMLHYHRNKRAMAHEHKQMIAEFSLEERFDEIYKETIKLLRHGDINNARRNYFTLSSIYEAMRRSSIQDARKSEYYTKLSALYSELHRIMER
jgi:tetratricopeptide (TPR) repeat protein